MMKIIILTFLALIQLNGSFQKKETTYTVLKVADGDTITVRNDDTHKTSRVRFLYEINKFNLFKLK